MDKFWVVVELICVEGLVGEIGFVCFWLVLFEWVVLVYDFVYVD